jgi:anti-anti-sigma regulatory factor
MVERLHLGKRRRGKQYVLQLQGQLDGSTACQALAAVYLAPADVREIVLDLARLSAVEPFGLDVLRRGVRGGARGRPVRFEGGAIVA